MDERRRERDPNQECSMQRRALDFNVVRSPTVPAYEPTRRGALQIESYLAKPSQTGLPNWGNVLTPSGGQTLIFLKSRFQDQGPLPRAFRESGLPRCPQSASYDRSPSGNYPHLDGRAVVQAPAPRAGGARAGGPIWLSAQTTKTDHPGFRPQQAHPLLGPSAHLPCTWGPI